MEFLKKLSAKHIAYAVVFVLVIIAGAAGGWGLRSCQAEKDIEEYKEAIRTFETESSKVLLKVTDSFNVTQQTITAAAQAQEARDRIAEDRHKATVQAIEDKLNERFAAIQDWYDAELVRRQEEIRDEINAVGDDPVDVGKLFMDLFGPGAGNPNH